MHPVEGYEGLFITLEGVDGSGKTSLVEAAVEKLDDIETTREPAEHLWTGEAARRAINSDGHPATDFHLFLGDRANHLNETIVPALERGKTVICDRYSDSTRAYQKEILGDAVEDPEYFIDFNLGQPWHLEPDLTLLLDITAEESARRTSEGDKYEKSAFIESVRDNYRELAETHDRIIYVNAENPMEAVQEYALAIIHEAQAQNAYNLMEEDNADETLK